MITHSVLNNSWWLEHLGHLSYCVLIAGAQDAPDARIKALYNLRQSSTIREAERDKAQGLR